MSYVILREQQNGQRKFYNQKSKRWLLDKSKATVFKKAMQAHSLIAESSLRNSFVVNAETMKRTRKPFTKRGKGEDKKLQIFICVKKCDIDRLGGKEVVSNLLKACISRNLQFLEMYDKI